MQTFQIVLEMLRLSSQETLQRQCRQGLCFSSRNSFFSPLALRQHKISGLGKMQVLEHLQLFRCLYQEVVEEMLLLTTAG
jgi:hypothetical protein